MPSLHSSLLFCRLCCFGLFENQIGLFENQCEKFSESRTLIPEWNLPRIDLRCQN
jgi:hypothetical protein